MKLDALRRCFCDLMQHVNHPPAIRRISIQTLRTWMRTVEGLNIRMLFHHCLVGVLGLTSDKDDYT